MIFIYLWKFYKLYECIWVYCQCALAVPYDQKLSKRSLEKPALCLKAEMSQIFLKSFIVKFAVVCCTLAMGFLGTGREGDSPSCNPEHIVI